MSEAKEQAQWGILELLGHRRLGGLVTEVEKFGTKMARIDIPDASEGAPPSLMVATQFYGPAAIYGFTPCTEDVARAEARWHQPRPVALLAPAPAAPTFSAERVPDPHECPDCSKVCRCDALDPQDCTHACQDET